MKIDDYLSPEEKDTFLEEREEAKKFKRREQANARKVLTRFKNQVVSLGFERKGNWFSRKFGNLAHVIHFHKYTYGPCFRMHICIRVLNDSFPVIALNGLDSQELDAFQSSLTFNDDLESIQACADVMMEAVVTVAEPWFQSNTEETLVKPGSPIIDSGREGLIEARKGKANKANVTNSKSLLGLA